MKVKKCVIPLAGLGSRMYPFTKIIPKPFLPIVDRDGFVKPALHLILLEAADSGVEEICLVVQPGQDEMIRRYLFDPPPSRIAQETQINKIEEECKRLGDLIKFAFQKEQRGFGHAIYCAKGFVNGEPFIVTLGDHLYHSYSTRRCIRLVVEIFERYSISITGLTVVGEDQVQSIGVVSGRFMPDENRVLRLERLVEKPTLSYARKYLRVEGVQGFLGNFGIDVLTPSIFEVLDKMIKRTPLGHEIQLRDAMAELIKSEGMLGYIVEGERFDIGTPKEYMKTLIHWWMDATS